MKELVLHQPPTRPWGTPNLSPFCTKLETYLRMAEIPYAPAMWKRGDAPKGKMPYVRIGDRLMGDSHLIIEELERELAAEGKRPLDHELPARDRAIGHMIRRAIEEGLYFINTYAKWHVDAGYAHTRGEFKKFIPGFVIPIVRREQRKKLHAQGTGRHTFDEVMGMGVADVDALAELLGDRPFLLGDVPRTVDCTVFAFLENLLGFPYDSPIRKRGLEHANLAAYRARVRERWWKELPALAS
jgi:glutathione S-transferase